MSTSYIEPPHLLDLDQWCDPDFGVDAEHAGHGCGRDPMEVDG